MEKCSGVKRSSVGGEGEVLLDGVKAVLVEVDGVLTPSSFVKDTLLQYVTDNAETYVTAHFTSDVITTIISDLRKQAVEDLAADVPGAVSVPEGEDEKEVSQAVAASIKWQLNSGRFRPPVGRFMIEILRSAFKSNALHGRVFEDVPTALKKLKDNGVKVHGYTGNCVEITKLQFEHSKDGDLSGLVSNYFGATVGSRVEKDTYSKLAIELELKPEEILYLTRTSTEATAAHSAGLKSCLVVREGNPEFTASELESFQSISSLTELTPGHDTSPHKKHRGSGDCGGDEGADTSPHKKAHHSHGDGKHSGCGGEKKHASHETDEAK